MLGNDGKPLAPTDAAANRSTCIIPVWEGPVVALSNSCRHQSARWLTRCSRANQVHCVRHPVTVIARPRGRSCLIVGSGFIVDGAQLNGPRRTEIPTATTTPATVTNWGPDRRESHTHQNPTGAVWSFRESGNPPDGSPRIPREPPSHQSSSMGGNGVGSSAARKARSP